MWSLNKFQISSDLRHFLHKQRKPNKKPKHYFLTFKFFIANCSSLFSTVIVFKAKKENKHFFVVYSSNRILSCWTLQISSLSLQIALLFGSLLSLFQEMVKKAEQKMVPQSHLLVLRVDGLQLKAFNVSIYTLMQGSQTHFGWRATF